MSVFSWRTFSTCNTPTCNTPAYIPPVFRMGTLFGLILLSVHCYGLDKKPPIWPEHYKYVGTVTSLTDGLEERYRTYVADKLNKQLIQLDGSREWPSVRAGDDIYVDRKETYDTVHRYFISFSGTLSPSCVTYNASKSFADSYRLPDLANPELNYGVTVSHDYSTIEQWHRDVKKDEQFTIMETVWITYGEEDTDKKNPIPLRRNYKEFTLPDGKLSVHKVYTYEYFVNKDLKLSPLFTPRLNKKMDIFRYSYENVTCTKNEFSYLVGGSDSKGKEEISVRQKLFDKRSQMVKEHNQRDSRYKLELNQFAYMSDEELKVYASCNDDSRINTTKLKHVEVGHSESEITLPESINWRLEGAVTHVKNQASCASCWAFAVVGAMESFYFINSKENELPVLSEQMLIDCVWDLNGTISNANRGCLGGKLEYGFEWISEFKGIQRANDYSSYLGNNGLCAYSPNNLFPLKKFKFIQGVKELKTALVQHGPVAVFIQADKNFLFYKSGIYDSKDDTFTNHAALLVGYDGEKGENYWLIKNSWGTVWGEDGYIRMNYTESSCGPIRYGFVPVE